jgi:hypothetical protein
MTVLSRTDCGSARFMPPHAAPNQNGALTMTVRRTRCGTQRLIASPERCSSPSSGLERGNGTVFFTGCPL